MEGLLATAVYFYALGFIYPNKILEFIGTRLFALCLLIPAIYLYIWLFQKFENATSRLSSPWYWTILILISIPFGILLIILRNISQRLEESDAAENDGDKTKDRL